MSEVKLLLLLTLFFNQPGALILVTENFIGHVSKKNKSVSPDVVTC